MAADDLVRLMLRWSHVYHLCADRHRRLADAVMPSPASDAP